MEVNPRDIAAPFRAAALDESGVGTWEIDVAEDMFRCDAVAGSIYELSVGECLAGVPLTRIAAAIHPADRAMWQARRELSMRYGGLFVIEYRLVGNAGGIRWVMVRGRYDAASDGRISRARGIVVDLTDVKSEGFADGQALLVEPLDGKLGDDPLEVAATHALAAHRALVRLPEPRRPSLLAAADALLAELGLAIAVLRAPSRDPATRH